MLVLGAVGEKRNRDYSEFRIKYDMGAWQALIAMMCLSTKKICESSAEISQKLISACR